MNGGTLAALIGHSGPTLSLGTVKTDRKLSAKQETPPPQVRRRSSSQTPPTTARDFHSFIQEVNAIKRRTLVVHVWTVHWTPTVLPPETLRHQRASQPHTTRLDLLHRRPHQSMMGNVGFQSRRWTGKLTADEDRREGRTVPSSYLRLGTSVSGTVNEQNLRHVTEQLTEA